MFYYKTKAKKKLQACYLCNLHRKFLSDCKTWKKVTNAIRQNTALEKKISLLSKQSCTWHLILTNKPNVFQVQITGCENLLVISAT